VSRYRGSYREQARARSQQRAADISGLKVEKDFYGPIRDMATTAGWLVFHAFDSRRSDEGFPDFVFVRDRVVFAEIKGGTTRITPAQIVWVERLRQAGAEAYIWRMPQGLDEAARVLGERRPGPSPAFLAHAAAGEAAVHFVNEVHRRHLAKGYQPHLHDEVWTPFQNAVDRAVKAARRLL
jgi:hypothetical protein